MSVITHTQCPVCNSSAIRKALVCRDFTVSNEQFEVWHCNNCTARFTQNIPSAAEVGRYYQSENYVSHSNTKSGLVNRLYHLVRSMTLKTKRDLVKKASGRVTGKLLDIGAGTGAFVKTMKDAGWQVTGLEPDDTARYHAREDFGIDLHTLDDLFNLPPASFDAITLWHVLEHVHELQAYVAKFADLLPANGVLLVAVPNYTSLDAEKYGEFWAAYDVPRHLYHFSPESMDKLMQSRGLRVQEVKPMWYDSFYVSMLSEKYKSGGNIPRAFFTGLRSNIKAYQHTRNCSSVIYIIRKA